MSKKTKAKMTQFEFTQNIVKNLPPLTKTESEEIKQDLAMFVLEHAGTKNFMLLSNEIRYYTIFNRKTLLFRPEGVAEKLLNFIETDGFLSELGKLKVLKRTDDDEIEIWIGETHFLFFDADSFFVPL